MTSDVDLLLALKKNISVKKEKNGMNVKARPLKRNDINSPPPPKCICLFQSLTDTQQPHNIKIILIIKNHDTDIIQQVAFSITSCDANRQEKKNTP